MGLGAPRGSGGTGAGVDMNARYSNSNYPGGTGQAGYQAVPRIEEGEEGKAGSGDGSSGEAAAVLAVLPQAPKGFATANSFDRILNEQKDGECLLGHFPFAYLCRQQSRRKGPAQGLLCSCSLVFGSWSSCVLVFYMTSSEMCFLCS